MIWLTFWMFDLLARMSVESGLNSANR